MVYLAINVIPTYMHGFLFHLLRHLRKNRIQLGGQTANLLQFFPGYSNRAPSLLQLVYGVIYIAGDRVMLCFFCFRLIGQNKATCPFATVMSCNRSLRVAPAALVVLMIIYHSLQHTIFLIQTVQVEDVVLYVHVALPDK